jgi:hypothetical protein
VYVLVVPWASPGNVSRVTSPRFTYIVNCDEALGPPLTILITVNLGFKEFVIVHVGVAAPRGRPCPFTHAALYDVV